MSNRRFRKQPLLLQSNQFSTEHTHCIPPDVLILPRVAWIKSSCLSLSLSLSNHALPNFKVRPLSPECRLKADWLKLCRATDLSYFVGQPTSNLSHDPRTPATKVAKLRNYLARRLFNLKHSGKMRNYCTAFSKFRCIYRKRQRQRSFRRMAGVMK